eukprot:CAMPEP_0174256610 /NCGR_PEP_ID=MMETSP0439-20130205/5832_1 /TAXON_ID=0 /ORGANISM="Stereomyxa ramosa, Strain Chinc5" /LENGTH=316 /DNA_ID=CAMNT_0015339309 /DNA_START=11 /DNA_END=961 /DNA_ORIENTATION=-
MNKLTDLKVGRSNLKQDVVDLINATYDLGDVIGEGSFSVVKKATHRETNQEFAVKIMSKEDVGEVHQGELLKEMEILTSVSHPNIIELKACYDTGEEIYFFMEYAPGGYLFDRVKEKGSYSESDARQLVRNITDAVNTLHENKIIHRDLKPENLLMKSFDSDTCVKIADFGMSKIISQERMLLTACGTPSYTAPETLTADGYDEGIDCWALGVISYILLCGFPPFTGDTLPQLLEKIMTAQFEYPNEYWADVSDTAKDFINRLLVVDREERMTAKQALEHPWLTEPEDAGLPLPKVSAQMEETQKKWKASRNNQSS